MTSINRIICSGESTEYSEFRLLKGNRFIDPARVERICTSITENGLFESHIKVNEDFEIIDGQHRFMACKKLGLPIFYDVHKGIGIRDCIALNTTQKNWTQSDYIKSFAEAGDDNYKTIIELIKTYPRLPLSAICGACTKRPSGGAFSSSIRMGTFKITAPMSEVKKILDYAERFRQLAVTREVSNVTPLLSVAIFAYLSSAIDEEVLLKKAATCRIRPFSTFVECRAAMEEVYNYRRLENNRVFFDYEYSKIGAVPSKETRQKIHETAQLKFVEHVTTQGVRHDA